MLYNSFNLNFESSDYIFYNPIVSCDPYSLFHIPLPNYKYYGLLLFQSLLHH
jgi:hypothetical protein